MRNPILVLIVGMCVLSGCSNGNIKKKPIGDDASTGEGSVAADTCDAGGIFNYSSGTCESCPAVVDAGMVGGMCGPPMDAGSGSTYQCMLTCSDVDFSKSSVDTTHQKISIAFTNYPLALTGVTMVYLAISASAADGGFIDASSQDYPTSLDHNVLTMDLSKMPAAVFSTITSIAPSGIELTDACGRPNSADLSFGFTKSNGSFVGGCFEAGPLDAGP